MRRSTPAHARGFSMIEVVMATATVGVMTVAALTVASSAATERRVASATVRGTPLAHALLDEIAVQSANPVAGGSEPVGGLVGGLGSAVSSLLSGGGGGGSGGSVSAGGASVSAELGAGAGATENRLLFTSLHSYDGWTSTPPRLPDGTAIDGAEGLTRSVTVTEVSPADPMGDEVADTGLFRVEVTVSRGPRVIATATMLRSQQFDGVAR